MKYRALLSLCIILGSKYSLASDSCPTQRVSLVSAINSQVSYQKNTSVALKNFANALTIKSPKLVFIGEQHFNYSSKRYIDIGRAIREVNSANCLFVESASSYEAKESAGINVELFEQDGWKIIPVDMSLYSSGPKDTDSRNAFMAKNINEAFQSQACNAALMIIGKGHLESANPIQKQIKVSSTTVNFISANYRFKKDRVTFRSDFDLEDIVWPGCDVVSNVQLKEAPEIVIAETNQFKDLEIYSPTSILNKIPTSRTWNIYDFLIISHDAVAAKLPFNVRKSGVEIIKSQNLPAPQQLEKESGVKFTQLLSNIGEDALSDIAFAISMRPQNLMPRGHRSEIVYNADLNGKDGTMAQYNPAYGRIEIGPHWLAQTSGQRIATIFHEFGHLYAVRNKQIDLDKSWTTLSGWTYSKTSTGDSWVPQNFEALVSIYAGDDPREDFAESFLAYRFFPEALMSLAPDKYLYMKTIVFKDSI